MISRRKALLRSSILLALATAAVPTLAETEEYAAFRKSLEEWAKVRDQWVSDRKQNLLQKWEETSFRLRLKQIEQGLRIQRRRLRAMTRAYP